LRALGTNVAGSSLSALCASITLRTLCSNVAYYTISTLGALCSNVAYYTISTLSTLSANMTC
jgi:uncharacterized membrane protein